MYWIRTQKGNGVNMALATDLRFIESESREGKHMVVAYFGAGNTISTIATGTEDEMRNVRDLLLTKLVAASEVPHA